LSSARKWLRNGTLNNWKTRTTEKINITTTNFKKEIARTDWQNFSLQCHTLVMAVFHQIQNTCVTLKCDHLNCVTSAVVSSLNSIRIRNVQTQN
jgi:hypothetical protein